MSAAAARWTSRKLVFSFAVFAVASWFRWLDLITAADWKQIATGALAIYGLANVAQKSITPKQPEPM